MFTQSMIDCHGIITGGGFETPAEAMFMGKRLMIFPIRGQYEQWCNAAAMAEWNIPTLSELNTRTGVNIHRWYYQDAPSYNHTFSTNEQIIGWMMDKSRNLLHKENIQNSITENLQLPTSLKVG